jgi:uncharacterized protein
MKYVLESGLRNRFTLAISIDIQAEILGKVRTKRPELLESAYVLLDYIRRTADVAASTVALFVVEDEPDNRILECAVAYGADMIVSFDKDLLSLKSYNNIAIIHPSQLQDYFIR